MTVNVQSTDSIKTTTDGVDFTSVDVGDTLIIDPNVFVTSQQADGVNSNGARDNTVINHGQIVSLASFGFGVLLNNGAESLTNAKNAEIFSSGQGGFSAGVELNGDTSNHLENLGTITGARSGVIFFQAAAAISANNFGSIFGEVAGIDIERVALSPFDGGSIRNFGAITSSNFGILANEEPAHSGLVTAVTNAAGGTISGLVGAISVGTLHLTNSGKIAGDITVDSSRASVIVNKGNGVITGQIFLQGGGNDTVMTGKSSVHVHVGTGSDIITAGTGHDQFIFDSALGGQFETIKNFTHGLDKIVLSLSDFPMLGAPGQLNMGHFDFGHATKAHPEIIYNEGSGVLSYDSNGNAPGGLHHFATLLGAPTISHADFMLL